MKKRIFVGMCSTAVIAVLLSTILLSYISYQQLYEQMKRATRNEAGYVVAAVEGAGTDYLDSLAPVTGARITRVDTDGTVLYDSAEPPEQMENHGDRKEIQEALKAGFGDAARLSDTMRDQTYYYAMRIEDGTVIRVSNTIDSVFSLFLNSIPLMVVTVLVAVVVAIFLARRQTKKILQPINALNLEHPLENTQIYDEIVPFLTRIEKQNHQLHEQIEAQRRQQEELTAITENMREGLVVIDQNAAVLSMNKSARRMLHVEENEFTGTSVYAYCRSKEFIGLIERVLDGEGGDAVIQWQERALRMVVSPAEAMDGAKGATLLLMDITETYSAEQMRREFSANVSHELKTPLTSISGYAELMMNGMVKQEDVAPFAKRIYDEANRLIALVQDIIKLSRLDEGTETLEMRPVNLLSLAHTVSDHLQALAEERHVTIQVDGEAQEVNGVPPLLEEMMFNLCENAVRYNKPDGHVTVTVGKRHGKAFFEVADTGIGIPEADHDRVFERFYRVDPGRSKQSGGTGLGLSIVKHAAACHHAEIYLESKVGEGTRITVQFPN